MHKKVFIFFVFCSGFQFAGAMKRTKSIPIKKRVETKRMLSKFTNFRNNNLAPDKCQKKGGDWIFCGCNIYILRKTANKHAKVCYSCCESATEIKSNKDILVCSWCGSAFVYEKLNEHAKKCKNFNKFGF